MLARSILPDPDESQKMSKFKPKAALLVGLAALALLVALVASLRQAGPEGQASVRPAAAAPSQAAEARAAGLAEAQRAHAAQAVHPKPDAASGDVARRWRVARERFAADSNWAALIQQTLAEPTAEGLFHAMQAMQSCDAARTFGVMEQPENAPCALVLEVHQSWFEIYRKQRSLVMSSEDRRMLDAILGSGEFRKSTPAARWAVVQATNDPLALAQVAESWSGRTDATYQGASLTEENSLAFANAWAVAACTRAGNCEASIGTMRLCKHQGQCEGSLVTRLEASMTQEQIERFRRALASV